MKSHSLLDDVMTNEVDPTKEMTKLHVCPSFQEVLEVDAQLAGMEYSYQCEDKGDGSLQLEYETCEFCNGNKCGRIKYLIESAHHTITYQECFTATSYIPETVCTTSVTEECDSDDIFNKVSCVPKLYCFTTTSPIKEEVCTRIVEDCSEVLPTGQCLPTSCSATRNHEGCRYCSPVTCEDGSDGMSIDCSNTAGGSVITCDLNDEPKFEIFTSDEITSAVCRKPETGLSFIMTCLALLALCFGLFWLLFESTLTRKR